MPIPGRLLTTAMAVMPHTDPDRALEDALSLDIPFWPQLPRLSYREDMYVQAAEHFPGIVLDLEGRTLGFSMDRFAAELEKALAREKAVVVSRTGAVHRRGGTMVDTGAAPPLFRRPQAKRPRAQAGP